MVLNNNIEALWLSTFVIAIFLFINIESKMVLRIDRFDFNLEPDSPWHIHKTILNHTDTKGTCITYDGYLDRDVSGKYVSLKVNLTRCANRESLDTCEYFRQLNPSNFCFFFEIKGMAWTELVEAFRPNFKCPFKKGRYQLDNRPLLNADLLKNIYSIQFVGPYFKATCAYYDNNKLLFQTYTEFRFINTS